MFIKNGYLSFAAIDRICFKIRPLRFLKEGDSLFLSVVKFLIFSPSSMFLGLRSYFSSSSSSNLNLRNQEKMGHTCSGFEGGGGGDAVDEVRGWGDKTEQLQMGLKTPEHFVTIFSYWSHGHKDIFLYSFDYNENT